MPTGKPWTGVLCPHCGRDTYFKRKPTNYSPEMGLWCGGCLEYEEECCCSDVSRDG